MAPRPTTWLFHDDGQPLVDKAVAQCARDHGGKVTGDPWTFARVDTREDGSRLPKSMVLVENAPDGWWHQYPRVHGWLEVSKDGIDRLYGREVNEASQARGRVTVGADTCRQGSSTPPTSDLTRIGKGATPPSGVLTAARCSSSAARGYTTGSVHARSADAQPGGAISGARSPAAARAWSGRPRLLAETDGDEAGRQTCPR